MKVLKAAVLYFLVVFGAGFVLGPIRILWVVPRLGTRMAELMEAPVMLTVTVVAARWLVQRLAVPCTLSGRLGMGFIAIGFLLIAECTLVLWLRGLSVLEYLSSRDPVSGTAYYLSVAVVAIMPFLIQRK